MAHEKFFIVLERDKLLMKHIKIIALVFVVGIVLLTGCAEETETKPEKEEKQKEYHSEEGRFSIEYITDWTMETVSDPLSGVKFKDPKDENAYFFVVHRPQGGGKIMRPMLLMALLEVHQSEKYEAPSAEIVTIGGKQGTGIFAEMTLPEKNNVRIKSYFIDLTYGNLEYWIVCCSSKENWEDKYWPIFDDMIGSVKFD